MAEVFTNFREVIPSQTSVRRWKDITVVTGAAQSTLQDIKLPESAGGFAYCSSNEINSTTRNRFIYWKVNHDVLELSEQSLDHNLTGNNVRFRFQDTPVLEGVSIHETQLHVVVLVATVSSVHRLLFNHPNHIQRHDFIHLQGTDQVWPSVFAEASLSATRDPQNFHVLCGSGSPLPHTAASWLNSDEEAIFALASGPGNIAIIRLPRPDIKGIVSTQDLAKPTILQRLSTWRIWKSGTADAGDTALSLCIHPLNQNIYAFALCRDHKLRMWSLQDYDCIMTSDVLEFTADSASSALMQRGTKPHVLRKALGSTSTNLFLGVFLCFTESQQFYIVQPAQISGQYRLNHISTIYAPKDHLIDFSLTLYHIWALWLSADSEVIVSFTSIDNENSRTLDWTKVILQPNIDREFHLADGLIDPREAYMQQIFKAGCFSVQTITKAINIYRRSGDSSFIGDINVPVNVLKEEVSYVVEGEIQNHASEYEMTAEEYFQLQTECWSRFYSCCVQYHDVETKMMGLLVDHNTGMVGLIKKNVFSLLRPQDPIEYLFHSKGVGCTAENIIALKSFSEDVTLCNDLIVLFKCLALVNSQLREDLTLAFKHDLFHNHSPDAIANAIAASILSDEKGNNNSSCFIQDLKALVLTIVQPLCAVEVLLNSLDFAHTQPENFLADPNTVDVSHLLSCSHLFSSQLGINVLAEAVHQLAETRLILGRDLLILLLLLQRCGETVSITAQGSQKIQTTLIPGISLLIQAYHVLLWITESMSSDTPSSAIEAGLSQLAVLNISEISSSKLTRSSSQQLPTLIEFFIQNEGGVNARTLLAQNQSLNAEQDFYFSSIWLQTLPPLMNFVTYLLWPVSTSFTFAEFLLTYCQHLQILEYVKLLQGWCEWNNSACCFILGHSYLNLGEPDKAVDYFLKATDGIVKDHFLYSKLLQSNEEPSLYLQSLYFLKVIRLFEQFVLPDQIITLAIAAINFASKEDPNIPVLWSIVFKYHLQLGHYEEAYSAIHSNVDVARKKDCLRQFVVVLCERCQYKKLVEFPYSDLHDDLVSILESRARSVDLSSHNYYDILYSFHIFRGNYRKASSIMYEHGSRLGNEVPGLKSLQKQAKCYLATLNCLHLVNPDYAWIVKPLPVVKNEVSTIGPIPGMSPKRTHEGDELVSSSKRQIEVLELSDIKKEYELIKAQLKLFKRDLDPSNLIGPRLTADETIALLVNSGMYDAAIHVCRLFNNPLDVVFEGLTTQCIMLSRLMKANPEAALEAWAWLGENHLSMNMQYLGEVVTVADHAWMLLQTYINTYEKKGLSLFHRCVAEKILSLGAHLPVWLIASYKKVNHAELLRLYLNFYLLEEATALVLEYLDAVMGKGKEYFGLECSLQASAPAVWVPYTSIELLLRALHENIEDPGCDSLCRSLEDKLSTYRNNLETISRDRIQIVQNKQHNS